MTGLSVLLILPFGFVLEPLPRSVLAVTVIVAVVPLLKLRRLVEVARLSRPQLTIALTAFFLTLALAPHVERAIAAAIVASIVIHLWRELRLDLKTSTDGDRLELVPQGVLWFGNARRLEDKFVDVLAEHPGMTELTVRLDELGRIDLTGAVSLKALIDDARSAGLLVTVGGAPPHADRVLRRVLTGDV